jgi:hypothetical protein
MMFSGVKPFGQQVVSVNASLAGAAMGLPGVMLKKLIGASPDERQALADGGADRLAKDTQIQQELEKFKQASHAMMPEGGLLDRISKAYGNLVQSTHDGMKKW